MMATPSDGVGQGLFGAESSTLGGAEDTVGRGSTHRHNADSETDDDESRFDEKLKRLARQKMEKGSKKCGSDD